MRNRKRLAQNKDDLRNLFTDDLLSQSPDEVLVSLLPYLPPKDDLVSQLPDEVLVSILSYLPLKDAAVTSKLSRRWRYLWCQTDCLVFEDEKRWSLIRNELDSDAETDKFMSWVNHVIHQHKSPRIDKFKICSGMDENAKGAISKWVEFAISKDVQTLELNLRRDKRTRRNYSFNVPVMEIKFLKTLILKCVNVNDEGLRRILSNCSVLEHLSIYDSCKLTKAQILGKDLALKNLDMTLYNRIISVEICDSNIVSFSCDGLPVALKIDNLQKLQKFSISIGSSLEKLNDLFCQMSCSAPYLQVLKLNLYPQQGSIEHHPFPKLQKLTQLIIKIVIREVDGLLVYAFLVEACPNLERLTIVKNSRHESRKSNWEARQMTKKPHQRLEVVEIVEYREEGGSDLESATYFIQNCVALKKLVIKPFMKAKLTTDETHAVRNRARQQLEPRTPVGVELVIL